MSLHQIFNSDSDLEADQRTKFRVLVVLSILFLILLSWLSTSMPLVD